MYRLKCLPLVLATLAAGNVFAQDLAREDGGGPFYAAGIGLTFDAGRSGNTDRGRFWSQIYAGPRGFIDAGFVEVSLGFAFGRMARQARWCFPLLAFNLAVLGKVPVPGLRNVSVTPLFGMALDAIVWARYECLRSDYTLATLSGHPGREFSALKLMLGFERDFSICKNRFFRIQILGYNGRRVSDNPNPWGANLRLGLGRRL